MKKPTLLLYALLLSVVLTPNGAISELREGVEETVEASSPIEQSVKSGEVELDEKTADEQHTSTETRIGRSSEATLDKIDANVESKTDIEAEGSLKTATEHEDKSAEVAKIDDKISEINDAVEEMSSERSKTGLNDPDLNENIDDLTTRAFNEDMKENFEDQINISRETTRSTPYETHMLDHKARTAENSEENLEIQAKSDLEAINADGFGSRRSYSGSPNSASFVTSGRSGQIFDDVPLSMPNSNSAMFNKITNQELIQPKSNNGIDPYIDPISSSEYRPLEQFSSNPFGNAYPFAFQPTTTTPSPAEISRYQDIGLLRKMIQPLENLQKPIARFLPDNFKHLPPLPFKPYEQNLPFPAFRPYNTRLNLVPRPSQPPRFYKKCTYCP